MLRSYWDGDEDDLDSFIYLLIAIYAYNGQRIKYNLTRSAVPSPDNSAWTHLFYNGDDQSFILLTGFDRPSFRRLKNYLFGNNEETHHRRPGRPPSLNANAKLGLYLFFVGSRAQYKYLCLLFGIVPSTCCDVIQEVRVLICKKLKHHPAARIRWPTVDEMRFFATLVNNREPSVDNVVGFVDGLSIAIMCDEESQATSYNGFYGDNPMQ